jgi:chitinase
MAKALKLRLIALPLLLVSLCSCGGNKTKDDDGNEMSNAFAPNFSVVCWHEYVAYLRDIDTDIMYVHRHLYHYSGLSVYFDAEGQPMTYAEFKVVHMAKYHV